MLMSEIREKGRRISELAYRAATRMASRGRGSFTEVHLCGGAMRRSLIQQVNASHQRASKGRICMRNLKVALSMASLGFVLAATAVLATPGPAGAIIHEMVGANCSFNGPPEPPGQAGASNEIGRASGRERGKIGGGLDQCK